ncbi:hypothetical protein B0H12DRAFT_1215551 [Mycena haematopus]|nr:hypothetical protein B0H12DRAFT_1215551 [Mycena haematopus]
MLPFRLSGLLLLLWLRCLAVVGATSMGDSGCNLFFCLNVTITGDTMTYQVTPIFEPFGWVGLGFGRQMKGTHMVVIWENEDESIVVSQRYGVGHVEPVLESLPLGSLLWSRHQTDPRPGQIIWAYSLRRPNPDPSSDLTGHYVAGTINMRLDKVVADLPGTIQDALNNPLPRYQKLTWHGILLSLGFLVLLPTGASYHQLRPRAARHRGGFILGPLAVHDRQARHFAGVHQICGLLLFAPYGTQLFLGRYIHNRRDVVGRPPHPPSNILHAVLGISIITLAFLQVRSGFGEWSKSLDLSHWCYDALVVWAVILPVLYFSGLVLLKRQFVQEKQGRTYDSPEGKNYIALSTAPSPILFDSEHEGDIAAYYSEFDSAPLLHRSAA